MVSYANSHNDLPTITEIQASTEVLSNHDAAAKVVRVKDRFAVKFGGGVEMQETENMRFVSANTNVPIPKLFSAFIDQETNLKCIIMEYVPGVTLQTLWPTLTAEEKAEITQKIRNIIQELRKLPAPGYLGAIGRKPFGDGVFWTLEYDPAISGPLANQAKMNEGILTRLRKKESTAYAEFMTGLLTKTLSSHRIVLMHGDLQPKNIMVTRTGANADGRKFDITIIDWEISDGIRNTGNIAAQLFHVVLSQSGLKLSPIFSISI
ncbi:hypothetical protein B7463_g10806, partial [Scytalidium lignicola]